MPSGTNHMNMDRVLGCTERHLQREISDLDRPLADTVHVLYMCSIKCPFTDKRWKLSSYKII